MNKITFASVVSWFDKNILLYLSWFLIIFIPLYPKLPLFDIIPGYIVRVRIEDIVILLTGAIWLVQLIRGKITWKTPLTWIIGGYALVGLLSTLSAIFITETVPLQPLHVGKTVLHLFRYLEYFFLFFLVVTTCKTKRDVKVFFALILITLVALTIYGYGQRFFFWPVYSTMNREFSKGIRLVLSEHARVQSTFGGHYDLGGYLVITLPIVLSAMYTLKNKWTKIGLTLIFLGGLWLLIQTAARASFGGFLLGSVIVIGIYALRQTTLIKKLWMFSFHSAVLTILMTVMLLRFGGDMYDRFLQVLEGYPALSTAYHESNRKRKEVLEKGLVAFISDEQISRLQEAMTVEPPPGSITTEEATVMTESDIQPSPVEPVIVVNPQPSDVYVNIPDEKLVATTSASGEVTLEKVVSERIYSDCALKYSLSVCIRYETLWPRAIAGFKKNPLLGSGYATLTKDGAYHFTEAESTDNNFLRTLGETGLLGFITFYGAIFLATKAAWYLVKNKDTEEYSFIFASSFIAATVGLLVNAYYIDVFAASKIAFTFWAIAGIVCAAYLLEKRTSKESATIIESAHVFKKTKAKHSK